MSWTRRRSKLDLPLEKSVYVKSINVVEMEEERLDGWKKCGWMHGVWMNGSLKCCDGCPVAYHSRCVSILMKKFAEDHWLYSECMCNKISSIHTMEWLVVLIHVDATSLHHGLPSGASIQIFLSSREDFMWTYIYLFVLILQIYSQILAQFILDFLFYFKITKNGDFHTFS